MKTERTSAKVASIAGRMLRTLEMAEWYDTVLVTVDGKVKGLGNADELQAVLASALTQAPNKKARKRTNPQANESKRKVGYGLGVSFK